MTDTRFIIYSQVAKIEEKFTRMYDKGKGPEAMFVEASRGWFVHLEGSRESLFLGTERPPFEVGDCIKISIEKVVNNGRQ